MRDLVLAKQFQDANIIFAVQDLSGNINYKIKEAGYQVEMLQSNRLEDLLPLVEKYDVSMVVLDHYGIDYAFEKRLKEKTGVKLFVLDDTYEKHHCDILLNHNIYADAAHYKGLVPDQCELRCGEKYILLRDEFIKAKQAKESLKDKRTKTVFIAMGGSDIANLNPKILKVLEQFENVQVDMVTTTANQYLNALEQLVEDKPWVNLHINSSHIAKLMAESDLAIVTPSVTMNEVWYMQIPFIAIKVADNQLYMYQYLKEKNMNVIDSFNENILERHLEKFLGD
jgi:UDP-2,4-diacetamido-2,4,6-trideoxy-beta-L-altropyranose hydrolase